MILTLIIYAQIEEVPVMTNISGKNGVSVNDIQLNFDAIDSMLREIQDESKSINETEVEVNLKEHDTINQTIEEVINKVNSYTCLECGKRFHRYMSYKQHWGDLI